MPLPGGSWVAETGGSITGSKAPVTGVDHSVVGVRDLEAAAARYRGLGFTVTPRGRHMGWATANYCIMFARDYVELLGVVDPGAYSAGLDALLDQRGEGILKLALASDDAAATHAFLAADGLVSAPVADLARELEAPEGTVLPRFRLVHPEAEATPGLESFVCQHLTPQLVWRKEWCIHRNTATRVGAYAILADDPSALTEGWVRIFGAGAISRAGGRLSVETGTARLDFLRWEDLPGAFSEADLSRPVEGTVFGMTVEVTDLVEAAACLAEAGAACMRTDEGITVFPESACGIAISFTEAG